MKTPIQMLIAALACLGTAPAGLADEASDYLELEVGRTRITCYTEPCPWNGIADADGPVFPVTMLWSGSEPPPMRGSIEDRAVILKHYADDCTRILGSYENGVLEIEKILGSC